MRLGRWRLSYRPRPMGWGKFCLALLTVGAVSAFLNFRAISHLASGWVFAATILALPVLFVLRAAGQAWSTPDDRADRVMMTPRPWLRPVGIACGFYAVAATVAAPVLWLARDGSYGAVLDGLAADSRWSRLVCELFGKCTARWGYFEYSAVLCGLVVASLVLFVVVSLFHAGRYRSKIREPWGPFEAFSFWQYWLVFTIAAVMTVQWVDSLHFILDEGPARRLLGWKYRDDYLAIYLVYLFVPYVIAMWLQLSTVAVGRVVVTLGRPRLPTP